jgi:diguanylate cyclase (GGDEF)-like protein
MMLFIYQFSFLTVICFSFLIVVSNYSIKDSPSISKIIAPIFLLPFLSMIFGYFWAPGQLNHYILLINSLTILLIALMIIINAMHPLYIKAEYISIILVLAVIGSAVKWPTLIANPHLQQSIVIIAGIAVIVCLVVICKNQHYDKFLRYAMLFMLAFAAIELYSASLWIQMLSSACLLIANILFYLFFHRQSYGNITARLQQADEKLTQWERSVMQEVKKRNYEIERSNYKLLDIAKLDALTQLYNKVNILSIINSLCDDRQKRPFTILMFDIDNFKSINDTCGHVAGDMTIKQVAAISRRCVRDIDSVGRYGGDEFIVVLPGTKLSDAFIVAERIRKQTEESESLNCTLSIGISSFPDDGQNSRELIKAADEGLYISKKSGRNTVSYYRSHHQTD